MRDIQVSVVSHGQSSLVRALLSDLGALGCNDRLHVTVTCNVPEDDISLTSNKIPVEIIRNRYPKGFSSNHNQAFRATVSQRERQYFLALNPDIRISEDVLTICADHLALHTDWGVVAPTVCSPDGEIDDSARSLPTPFGLLRKLAGNSGTWPRDNARRVIHPDWVAGMFMMFRAPVFAELGGFDERYFLYYEDVDICCRSWLCDYAVALDQQISVVHAARRASRSSARYAFMHLSSMLRFFSSGVYRRAKTLHLQRAGAS